MHTFNIYGTGAFWMGVLCACLILLTVSVLRDLFPAIWKRWATVAWYWLGRLVGYVLVMRKGRE